MSCIDFYSTEKDFEKIFDFLSRDEEIAFIIPSKEKNFWKTVNFLKFSSPHRYSLWHVPSGPLPYMCMSGDSGFVSDPWSGWFNDCLEDEFNPFLDSGVNGLIRLDACIEADKSIPELGIYKPGLALSHFEWVGNHYSAIGNTAHPKTLKFWNKLKKFISREGVKIPRSGALPKVKGFAWAFPDAYLKIKNGYPRNAN